MVKKKVSLITFLPHLIIWSVYITDQCYQAVSEQCILIYINMFMVLHISQMCLTVGICVLRNNPINCIQYLMYSTS
jgi:hypothetical protein